jgi:hypothetical protein
LRNLVTFILLVLHAGVYGQVIPLPNAHAHNDYEHKRPLFDALDNGFISVEADIYLIDRELFVSHDPPAFRDTARTLESLYLLPLLTRIRENGGKVYPGYNEFFYLMIDIKTEGKPTSLVLEEKLKNYEEMISIVRDAKDETGKPVKIFLSGNRKGEPTKKIMEDKISPVSLDGKPEDLGKNIPASLMPVVSDHYRRFLSWSGEGKIDPGEEKKLKEFIKQVHAEGKKSRLWGGPDRPEVWDYLLNQGLDLINTDKLEELAAFLHKREAR